MKLLLILSFALFLHVSLSAQTDSLDQRSVGATLSQDANVVWRDMGEIFLAPIHFDRDAWIATGAVAAGTVIFIAIDDPARETAMRNRSAFGDDVFEVGQQYGREIYGLAFSGALYVGGLALRNDGARSTGLMLFESITFAGITTTVLKTVIGRSRPYLGEGPHEFRGFQLDNDYLSLPSGHSTIAFSVSTVLAARLKNTYAGIGLYSLATLTMFSRVYTDDHWLSDTFLGAAIGTAVGLSVVALHEHREEKSSIRFTPTFRGVRITYIF